MMCGSYFKMIWDCAGVRLLHHVRELVRQQLAP
jgi:hypothetical protein